MISRARPLLGTIVSIRSDAEEPALAAAFSAIEAVHWLMSAQAEEGDLARVNRSAHCRAVCVHPWTYEVLAFARAMSEASDGAFDVTLGRQGASYADIGLLAGNRVRLRRPARLDLGGIAKGFAVDRAVAALRSHGARSGSVNAGGDLRLFGTPQIIRVRLPGAPGVCVPLFTACEQAVATSGSYFGSLQADPRSGQRLCADYSVTVRAATCMAADALTKTVAASGPKPQLLKRFDAQAFLLDSRGRLHAARI